MQQAEHGIPPSCIQIKVSAVGALILLCYSTKECNPSLRLSLCTQRTGTDDVDSPFPCFRTIAYNSLVIEKDTVVERSHDVVSYPITNKRCSFSTVGENSELRNCVKVEVAVLGSRP